MLVIKSAPTEMMGSLQARTGSSPASKYTDVQGRIYWLKTQLSG